MIETKYKCPTCSGEMWMDYESWMGGKDYFYKCSKKKHDNPNCQDKQKYWECEKCEKPSFACLCDKRVLAPTNSP